MKNILTLLLFCLAAMQLFAQTPTPYLSVFANGFTRPCDITHCGDDRLFVVEQRGKIWVLNKNGTKLPTPFLDIDPSVGSSGNEQGLLGLAFHPEYPTTPYFYVNYTDNSGDTKVSRFSVSIANPNLADANSELVLLTADQPYANHNGGCVKFGPDGYLYIGLGDGGSGGDPQNNGQKRTTFLGKMLRIDVDGGSTYAVPPTNPFVNDPNTLPEIWAIGVRNPWRYSFDRLTGDLWMGDVGQDAWEEIDFQPASSPGGENYGWRCYEGNHPFNNTGCVGTDPLTYPVAEYVNGGGECSVTGGFVYRGFKYPTLYGHYLFTDYCSGKLWWLKPNLTGGFDKEQIGDFVNNQMVSFGENKNGELLMLGNSNGNVYGLVDSSEVWDYTVNITQPACAGSPTGSIIVSFNSAAAAAVLTWEDGFQGLTRTDLASGTYNFTITGANGSIANESITLTPGESLTGTVTDASCLGANDGSIDLTLNGTTAPPASVTWSNGSTDLDLTGLSGGEYSVSVTTAAGCVFEETFLVNEPVLTSPPFINLTMDSVLQVEDVWDAYQWLLNGQPIPDANAPVYIATESGTYTVQVGSNINCQYLSNSIEVNLTAANEVEEISSVSITPNPFQQTLTLTVTVKAPVLLDLSLSDLQGRNILNDRLYVTSTATKTLELGDLPAGNYLLLLKNGKGEWVERVVKL